MTVCDKCHVSIPNGKPRPFSRSMALSQTKRVWEFQSQTGSPDHLAYILYELFFYELLEFQSQTGSPDHLALSQMSAFEVQAFGFNPKREAPTI